jgi:hypothetical protein
LTESLEDFVSANRELPNRLISFRDWSLRPAAPIAQEEEMSAPTQSRPKYVKVKDSSGNEWLCPLDAMKNAKDATQEDLDECVELDVVQHNPSLINVER